MGARRAGNLSPDLPTRLPCPTPHFRSDCYRLSRPGLVFFIIYPLIATLRGQLVAGTDDMQQPDRDDGIGRAALVDLVHDAGGVDQANRHPVPSLIVFPADRLLRRSHLQVFTAGGNAVDYLGAAEAAAIAGAFPGHRYYGLRLRNDGSGTCEIIHMPNGGTMNPIAITRSAIVPPTSAAVTTADTCS